ncbi:MAG: ABC transporter ATP-binding protein [Pseudomonadota bacterium]
MKVFERLIDPFVPADAPPPTTIWAYGRWAIRGAEWPILLLMASSLALGILEAVAAFVVAWAVDLTVNADRATFFSENAWLLLAAAAFFLILRPLLNVMNGALTSRTLGPNLYPMGVLRIHRHLLGQQLSYFEEDFAGRLTQKEIQTTYALVEIINDSLHAIFFGLATVVGTLIVLQGVDRWLAALILGWFGAYVFLIWYFMPKIRVASRRRADGKSLISGQLVDSVAHMGTVKLFAHAGREHLAAEGAVRTYRDAAFAFGRITWIFRAWLAVLSGALPFLLMGLALWLWQQGQATAGTIALAGLISTRLAQMSGWISFTAMGIFTNVGVLEDGIRTLTPPPTLEDAPDAEDPPRLAGRVAFQGVGFQYGRRVGGVSDIDLTMAAGERLALVGHSGAGKSTLAALLPRLYDVERGRITIDGIDIRAMTQDGLRRQIAMVTQDTAMFNRSALDNILYGNPKASEEAAIAAARQAQAHDFIQDLTDRKGREGYAAHLGERGVKLSGGQRQRIALARAILKDAPILILDEATSALDSESEAAIQAVLATLMRGKTVLAIAHRLSTISHMDRIVVMDQGSIVEQGTHDGLLAQGGLYAGFWSRQTGGMIGVEAQPAA